MPSSPCRGRTKRLDGLAGRDLALASAGASLYAALALVPSLLVAIAVGQLFLGRDGMERYGLQVARNMPDAIGAEEWTAELVRAGLSLSVVGVVFAASVTNSDTGYALSSRQVSQAAAAGRIASRAVSTQGCAA